MLTCLRTEFTGRLSCRYDRPYRLCGSWEAALISFTNTVKPVYILCDLLDYTYINKSKVQLLKYFYSPRGITNGSELQYVKVLHKGFNTINIDVNMQMKDVEAGNWGKVFSEGGGESKEQEEITCLIHFRRVD